LVNSLIPTQTTDKTINAGKVIWYYDWRKTWTQEKAVFYQYFKNSLPPLDDMIGDPVKKVK